MLMQCDCEWGFGTNNYLRTGGWWIVEMAIRIYMRGCTVHQTGSTKWGTMGSCSIFIITIDKRIRVLFCEMARSVSSIGWPLESCAPFHTRGDGRPPTICGDKSEVELQIVCQRCHTFCSTRIFADHNCFLPSIHICSYPSCDEWFRMEIVDWLSKESLAGRSVQVHCYNMVDAGDREYVGQQPCSYRTSM